MIVLDTNVVSELMRPSPSPVVGRWVRNRPPADLYTTSITVAEIGYGIERLPEGQRKDVLAGTAAEVFSTFADHILPFDDPAAAAYPAIVVGRERAGTPISGFDAQIAAICRTHRATLASRNVADFDGTGVEVLDPWTSRPGRRPPDP